MSGRVYVETFDDGPGGWLGWESNATGAKRLEVQDGAAISRSPWWIDYNHAEPGGGYLHLLFALHTRQDANVRSQYAELSGRNRFAVGEFPMDFTNARMTLRLKGAIEARGAALLLLIQSRVGGVYVNYVLAGQSYTVAPEWTEQTVWLSPDPAQWKCMGARHDRTDFYGVADIKQVLSNVNRNIIMVLHPLDVVPSVPLSGNPHLHRAGEDYPVDTSRLPAGHVMLDGVRIEFAA